jgi:large subunit ribosomal protein L2
LEQKLNLNLSLIKLPSGKKIFVNSSTYCLLGRNNNINKKYEIYAKASYNIKIGKNPNVRGVAKNPVDHPHGGRTKTVQPEVSP